METGRMLSSRFEGDRAKTSGQGRTLEHELVAVGYDSARGNRMRSFA